jgi:hypothetical protein
MKKVLVIIAAIFASLVMFYGAVSAMVNQGNSLLGSIITFFLVVAGGIILVKSMKPDKDYPPEE